MQGDSAEVVSGSFDDHAVMVEDVKPTADRHGAIVVRSHRDLIADTKIVEGVGVHLADDHRFGVGRQGQGILALDVRALTAPQGVHGPGPVLDSGKRREEFFGPGNVAGGHPHREVGENVHPGRCVTKQKGPGGSGQLVLEQLALGLELGVEMWRQFLPVPFSFLALRTAASRSLNLSNWATTV